MLAASSDEEENNKEIYKTNDVRTEEEIQIHFNYKILLIMLTPIVTVLIITSYLLYR